MPRIFSAQPSLAGLSSMSGVGGGVHSRACSQWLGKKGGRKFWLDPPWGGGQSNQLSGCPKTGKRNPTSSWVPKSCHNLDAKPPPPNLKNTSFDNFDLLPSPGFLGALRLSLAAPSWPELSFSGSPSRRVPQLSWELGGEKPLAG